MKKNMEKFLCCAVIMALIFVPRMFSGDVYAEEDVREEGDSFHLEKENQDISLMSLSGTYRMPSYRTTRGNVGIIPEFSSDSMNDPCWFSRLTDGNGTVTIAYCIEYLTFSSDGDGYDINHGTEFENNDLLSDALYYGFHDDMTPQSIPTDSQRSRYLATQGLIWSIMRGIYDTAAGDRAVKQLCDKAYCPEEAWQYYLDIKSEMNSRRRVPNFASRDRSASPVYPLEWDSKEQCFKGVFADDNGTLDAFEFTGDNVRISKEGGRLTVRSDSPLDGQTTIQGTKNAQGAPLGACLIWTNDNLSYQKVASAHGIPEVQAFFRVKTEGIPGKVIVQKKDRNTGKILTGGEFALYEWDGENYQFAGILTDKGDGRYIRDSLLATSANGGRYKVEEVRAPKGYYNQGWSKEFVVSRDKREVLFNVENQPICGTIRLIKVDHETEAPQGDASLQGAIYEVYRKNTDEVVGTMVTDDEGFAMLEGLPLGTYLVKESQASEGYLLDERTYEVCLDSEDDKKPVVEATVLVTEQVMKQPVALIKLSDEKVTPAKTLEGVGFKFYLKSQLKGNEKGEYDFESARPVVVTDDGEREIFTDENGQAVTCKIPYGTYIVTESTVPKGFEKAAEFTVEVKENSDTPQAWLNVINTSQKQRVRITKKDDDTGASVLKAGATFQVYDVERESYVCQEVTYPRREKIKEFTTDETGSLMLPEPLPFGKYRLEEVKAPDGYINDGQTVDFEVTEGGGYTRDTENPDVLEVAISNQSVEGKIVLKKTGEILVGYDKEMIYEVRGLPGVKFQIYSGERIRTPDNQGVIIYEEGDLVSETVTGEDGVAVVENLPLGEYVVKEAQCLPGFLPDQEEHRLRIEYDGQETGVVTSEYEIRNVRGKLSLHIRKTDGETGKGLEGVSLSLFTSEPIYNSLGEIIIDADEKLMTTKSGKDGIADFDMDLPFGKYYVKEEQALDGYILTDEIIELDGSARERTDPYMSLMKVMENKKEPRPTRPESGAEETTPKPSGTVGTGDEIPVPQLALIMTLCGLVFSVIIIYSVYTRKKTDIEDNP